MPRLTDTHCHLAHGRLRQDLAGVVQRAEAAGVVACICVGADLNEARAAQSLSQEVSSSRGGSEPGRAIREGPGPAIAMRQASQPSEGNCPRVFFTAGVHPHDAKDAAAGYLAEFERLAADPKCVALGEMGLDYHYDFSPRPEQQRVLAEQLALARRLGKPVVIHTREAFDDTLAILRESGVEGSRLVFHSFTEPPEQGRRALELGAMISFSGIVTFAKSDSLRQTASQAPEDRILIETDAPFLSPEPVRKMKTNEPANVAHVAACLARLRGTTLDAFAELTTANAMRFFRLDMTPA